MHRSRDTAFTIGQALDSAEPLQRLSSQLARSRRRMELILPLLPPPLRSGVHSGGGEAERWSLLVAHHAAASKVRQLAPALLRALNEDGDPVREIRIRVRRDP